MGFDTSYHSVDPAFVHDQLFPIVRGEKPGDELFAHAARIAKVRFIANAWGLAVSGVWGDELRSRSEVPAKRSGLLGRLFGKASPPSLVGAFDSDLHVWGRPFFVVAGAQPEVSRVIDRYLEADAQTAAELARQSILALNPSLLDGAKAPGERARTLQQHFEKQMAGMPSDAEFDRSVRWKIDLFRAAHAALGKSEAVKDDEGQEHDPAELFTSDFALAAVEFASIFRPGWMDRGTVWPTHLMAKAGLEPSAFFQTADPLFAPLLERVPQIRGSYDVTIKQNYMLGGYVPADKVPGLLDQVKRNLGRLKAVYDGGAREVPTYLRKQVEALQDAAHRRLAFLEATEVYSGPSGQMS